MKTLWGEIDFTPSNFELLNEDSDQETNEDKFEGDRVIS